MDAAEKWFMAVGVVAVLALAVMVVSEVRASCRADHRRIAAGYAKGEVRGGVVLCWPLPVALPAVEAR